MKQSDSITDIVGVLCKYARQGDFTNFAKLADSYRVDIHKNPKNANDKTILMAICAGNKDSTTSANTLKGRMKLLNILVQSIDDQQKQQEMQSNIFKQYYKQPEDLKQHNNVGSPTPKIPNINHLAPCYFDDNTNQEPLIGKVSALYYTITNENFTFFAELIKRGAAPNQPQGTNKVTPLMLACARGSLPFIQKLLDLNVDINQEDNDGNSPITVAIEFGHFATAQLLINHPQFFSRKILNNENLIDLIIKQHAFTDTQKTILIKTLLEKGTNIFESKNDCIAIAKKLTEKTTLLAEKIKNKRDNLLKYCQRNNLSNSLNFFRYFDFYTSEQSLTFIRNNYFKVFNEIISIENIDNPAIQKLSTLWKDMGAQAPKELMENILTYFKNNKERVPLINANLSAAQQTKSFCANIHKIYPYLAKNLSLKPLKEIIDNGLYATADINFKNKFVKLLNHIKNNPQLAEILKSNKLNNLSKTTTIILSNSFSPIKISEVPNILQKHFEKLSEELQNKLPMQKLLNSIKEIQHLKELRDLKSLIINRENISLESNNFKLYKNLYPLLASSLALATAIKNNDLLLLRKCFNNGTAPLQAIDKNARTALRYAAEYGQKDIINLILLHPRTMSLFSQKNEKANLKIKNFITAIKGNNNLSSEDTESILSNFEQQYSIHKQRISLATNKAYKKILFGKSKENTSLIRYSRPSLFDKITNSKAYEYLFSGIVLFGQRFVVSLADRIHDNIMGYFSRRYWGENQSITNPYYPKAIDPNRGFFEKGKYRFQSFLWEAGRILFSNKHEIKKQVFSPHNFVNKIEIVHQQSSNGHQQNNGHQQQNYGAQSPRIEVLS